MSTVMIVEDQADVQKLLGVALGGEGLRTLHALDAETAWDLLQTERPDVILLDIMMPGAFDGMALLQRIRQDRNLAAIKVMVVSARAQERDKAAAFTAGADDFLAKPFRLNELKGRLHKLLH